MSRSTGPAALSSGSPGRVRPTPRRARLGVSLLFFTNGALISALLPRLPEVKANLALSNADFGLLVTAFPVGALVAATAAAPLVRRWGARHVAACGSAVLGTAFTLAAAAGAPSGPIGGSVWLFAGLMALAGATDAVVDSAQNIQGVAVEQWRGRSLMNSLHAFWSLGAAVGGVIGAIGAAAQLALPVLALLNGVTWTSAAFLASRLSAVPDLPRRAARGAPTAHGQGDGTALPGGAGKTLRRRATIAMLAPLAVLSICGTLLEDVANNWVVLFLRQDVAGPVEWSGLGLSVVLAAQFIGRLLGDRMTDRWGRERVAMTGGMVVVGGIAMVLTAPVLPAAFLGFGLMGFGSATLVPAAFAAAGRLPGLREGSGIAALSWLLRVGFLITSPVVGLIAESEGLRAAMWVPLAGGACAALVAHTLVRGSARPPARDTSVTAREQVTSAS